MRQNMTWLIGQAVKTPPSHGGNRGSIPLSAVIKALKIRLRISSFFFARNRIFVGRNYFFDNNIFRIL